MTDRELSLSPSVIPTGHPALDSAMGGGLPRARMTTITGGPRTASPAWRSLFALDLAGRRLARGERVAFFDLGGHADPCLARTLGFDLTAILSTPPSIPAALEQMLSIVRAHTHDLLIVVSTWDIRSMPGTDLRRCTVLARRLAGALEGTQTALLVVDVHAIGARGHVPPTLDNFAEATPPGGSLALGVIRFYASVYITCETAGTLHVGDKAITRAHLRVMKNKVAPPFGSAVVGLPVFSP